eukprot:gene21379-32882_t
MTGLRNLGNTCFFNSVCQGLAQTAPLVDYLLEDDGVVNGRIQGDLSIALCVFLRLLDKNRGKVLDPSGLWGYVCRKHETFRSHAQQDAQEMLAFLLVALESEYANRERAQNAVKEEQAKENGVEAAADNEGASSGHSPTEAKKKKKKKKKTSNIISKCFRGTFDSVLQCRGCGGRSVKTDDYFRDISVEIPTQQQPHEHNNSGFSYSVSSCEVVSGPSLPMNGGMPSAEHATIERLKTLETKASLLATRKAIWREKKQNSSAALHNRADPASLNGGSSACSQSPTLSPKGKSSSTCGEDEEVAGLPTTTRKEAKLAKQRGTVEKEEGEVRAKLLKELSKAETVLLSKKPVVRGEGVVACCMRGVSEYAEQYEPGVPSVVECLRSFFSPEKLEDDNLYHCGKCNTKCPAEKQLSIASPPAVLTVHLKRFQHDYTGTFRKLGAYVSFPLVLQLDPFMSGHAVSSSPPVDLYHSDPPESDLFADGWAEKERCQAVAEANGLRDDAPVQAHEKAEFAYRLFAVVAHSGSLNCGHYFAYVRPYDRKAKCRSNRWYKTSDSHVTEVSVFK